MTRNAAATKITKVVTPMTAIHTQKITTTDMAGRQRRWMNNEKRIAVKRNAKPRRPASGLTNTAGPRNVSMNEWKRNACANRNHQNRNRNYERNMRSLRLPRASPSGQKRNATGKESMKNTEDVSLADWTESMMAKIRSFADYWNEAHAKQPDRFSLKMWPGNWDAIFAEWLDTT